MVVSLLTKKEASELLVFPFNLQPTNGPYYLLLINTPVGLMVGSADQEGLYTFTYFEFHRFLRRMLDVNHQKTILDFTYGGCRPLDLLLKWLTQYFQGKKPTTDVPMHIAGTSFQQRAWKALSNIPYGTTLTYEEQGKLIQAKHALRAVGNANAKNPFCILLPCHRIVRKNGTLGGYAGGVQVKQALLKLEGAID